MRKPFAPALPMLVAKAQLVVSFPFEPKLAPPEPSRKGRERINLDCNRISNTQFATIAMLAEFMSVKRTQ
jgi:hypothetical protein